MIYQFKFHMVYCTMVFVFCPEAKTGHFSSLFKTIATDVAMRKNNLFSHIKTFFKCLTKLSSAKNGA